MSGSTSSASGQTGGPDPSIYIYPTQDDFIDEFPGQMKAAMEALARHTHPYADRVLEETEERLDEIERKIESLKKRNYAVPHSKTVYQDKTDKNPGFRLDVDKPERTVVQVMATGDKSERCFCYYNKDTRKWVVVQVLEKVGALPGAGGNGGAADDPPESGGNDISDTSGVTIYRQPDGMGNREYIWRMLITNGYSEKQVAGILGNLKIESGFDPTIDQQGGGPGRGIAQWETSAGSGRWDELVSWANSVNRGQRKLETQVEFMLREMRGKQSWSNFSDSAFKSTSTIRDACKYFLDKFEGTTSAEAARMDAAEHIYNDLSGVEGWPKANAFGVMPFVVRATTGDRVSAIADGKFQIVYYTWQKHPKFIT